MKWRNGRITSYRLTTTSKPTPVQVKVNGEVKTVTPEAVTTTKASKPGKKKKEKAASGSLDNSSLIGWGLGGLLLLVFIIIGNRRKS